MSGSGRSYFYLHRSFRPRFLWNEGEKNGREGFRLTAKDHLPRGLTRLQQREIQTATKEWQSLETCGLIWTERCLHKFIILTIHNIMGEIQKSPVFCFGLKVFRGGGEFCVKDNFKSTLPSLSILEFLIAHIQCILRTRDLSLYSLSVTS